MRARARYSVAFSLCGILLGSGGLARAEPSARFVYLRGKGTETCPSESEVREAVQVRLGYDPFSTYAASTMFAEVASTSGGYTASLKLVDGDNAVRGDRTLKVLGDCAALMDAMALTISIAIDPMSVTRSGPPPGTPPTEKTVDPTPSIVETEIRPEPANAAAADRAAGAPTSSAEGTSPMAFVSLGPLASLGSAPALSMGASLGVDAQLGWFVAGLEGRADLPSSAAAEGLGRVESSLLAATVFGGVREGLFSAGLVGTMGRLAATSSDVARSREESATFLAAGLRIGVAVPLSRRIEARARAEALANLLRHKLEISGREAFEYPIASGNVSLAIAARFW
ncbi:MAG: hypothetical protein KF764_28090 [Labilithrix sp.]|nr:hypothetical protein [Labilithrix sp.]